MESRGSFFARFVAGLLTYIVVSLVARYALATIFPPQAGVSGIQWWGWWVSVVIGVLAAGTVMSIMATRAQGGGGRRPPPDSRP